MNAPEPSLAAHLSAFLSTDALRALGATARATAGDPTAPRPPGRHVLDDSPAAVAIVDPEMRYVYVNEALARVNGLSAREHLGRVMAEIAPGSGAETDVVRGVLDTGRPRTLLFDERPPITPGNAPRWWLGAFHRIDGDDGEVLGVAAIVLEVTERIRREQSLSRARNRLELLEETSARVGSTLDAFLACDALTTLLAPRFVDYAAVDVIDDDGVPAAGAEPSAWWLRRMAVTVSPAARAVAPQVTRGGEIVFHQASSSMARVLTRHRPEVLNRPDDATVRLLAPTPERLEHYRRVGLHSLAYLPLMHGGEPIGAVIVGRRGDSPEFSADDVDVLEQITARAAICIGHALRYTQEHETTLEMQRAFLATPNRPGPGVEIASRYLPAGRGAEVGGDWFDTVALPGGRTLLVVGDVMGHGMRAAAAMSEYRSLIRALALQGLDPARLLAEADRTAHTLDLDRVATCVLALLDPEAGHAVLATAGHVPPLLARPGARPELAALPVGPPLGTGTGAYAARHVPLPPRTLLLLYTDGLVERRGADIDLGLSALADTPLGDGDGSLKGVLETVLGWLAPVHSEDDVTLLAARVEDGRTAPAPAA
jgi:PAS domain S-box-containing protein